MAKFCPNCGSKIPEKAKFCTDCGERLDGQAAEQKTNLNVADSVIHNSQIGQASVGSVYVSPTMKQEMHSIQICPDCRNVVTDSNTLHYCRVCNKSFCDKCQKGFQSPVLDKQYSFTYELKYTVEIDELVRNTQGYMVPSKRRIALVSAQKVDFLKSPLCDGCYDSMFVAAMGALKYEARKTRLAFIEIFGHIEKGNYGRILDMRGRVWIEGAFPQDLDHVKGMTIAEKSAGIEGINPLFVKDLALELEGCDICKGTGTCVQCRGHAKCASCGGNGRCISCLGGGRCGFCRGTKLCPKCNGNRVCTKCFGKGKGLIFTCSECHGSGVCPCGTGHDPNCAGSGRCRACSGSGRCNACAGSGKSACCNGTGFCSVCRGTGNANKALTNDDFGNTAQKIRGVNSIDTSKIHLSIETSKGDAQPEILVQQAKEGAMLRKK